MGKLEVKSKVNGETIHIVYRKDFDVGRADLVSEDQFLQVAALNLPAGKMFRPHIHLWHDGSERTLAQEAWVVIYGRIEVFYYDIDAYFLCSEILRAGDVSITLHGGHTYPR